MPRLFFLLFLLMPSPGFSSPIEKIQTILDKVSQRSANFKVLQLEELSDLKSNESVFADFDYTGSAEFSLQNSTDPQTSPFSSDSTRQYDYSLGLSKLWQSGLDTSLNYSLTSNLTTFPARSDSDFLYPTLSLSLETKVFRDLFGGKQASRVAEQKLSATAISIQSKVQQKAILIAALLALADTLDTQNNLALQKSLCNETRAQNKVLKSKWQRKSISQRDFILGSKDLNTCLITETSLATSLKEKVENLKTQYHLDTADYSEIDIDVFFAAIVKMYNSESFEYQNVRFDHIDELIALKADLKVLSEKENQVNADLKPDLSLSLSGGVQGLDSSLGSAHSNLTSGTYPYVLASVSVTFPFQNRTAEIAKIKNQYSQEIAKTKLAQQEREYRSRVKVLAESIKSNLINYSRLKENESLSIRALREAERDFRNGRINFQSLSEFNQGLIQSRQSLSRQRAQVVVQLTEYFDFFQFFDRFFPGKVP